MNDGGPLLEELDVAEGVEVGDTVDELEVAVAVGERVEERLGELLGANGFGTPSCRLPNSTPDKCIVLGLNECEETLLKLDDSSAQMADFGRSRIRNPIS
jgi:hypothetical protein